MSSDNDILKNAECKIENIINNVDKLRYLDLVFAFLDESDIKHLIIYVNGFDDYNDFQNSVINYSCNEDKRLHFLHPETPPDKTTIKERFFEWIQHYYTKRLQHQILNYTDVASFLNLDESMLQNYQHDTEIRDLININYNNVLVPELLDVDDNFFIDFTYNAKHKLQNDHLFKEQRLQNTIAQTTGNNFEKLAHDNHLTQLNSKAFQNLFQVFSQYVPECWYYTFDSMNNVNTFIESFQMHIQRPHARYISNEAFVLQHRKPECNHIVCHDMVNNFSNTFINSIFFVDLNKLSNFRAPFQSMPSTFWIANHQFHPLLKNLIFVNWPTHSYFYNPDKRSFLETISAHSHHQEYF